MATIQFVLAHGTSKECAESIQNSGFRLSEMGFWGPAAYFYDVDNNGIENAKRWIDKKISNGHIPNRSLSLILISGASSDDSVVLDGTIPEFIKIVEKVASNARKIAWTDAKEKEKKFQIPPNRREIEIKVNRERNAVIAELEKKANMKFHIFLGLLKNTVCVAVRDVSCLDTPPYTEVSYE